MAVFDKDKFLMMRDREKKVEKQKIMIVDDEVAHLRSMESLLSEYYQIITACDGQDALDMIKKMESPENISLIISDQRMPKLTGIELFKELLKILPKTIRIILTGFVDIPVVIDAINKTQIYQFIQKPFEPEDLKLTIKNALRAFETEKKIDEYRITLEERNRELEKKNIELLKAKRKLEESSLIDPLTELRNRKYIENFIQNDISKVQREYNRSIQDSTKQVSPANDVIFLLMDIDNLKSVNCKYNHKSGDIVLKQLTGVLQNAIRQSDILVRWGNDEFLIVLFFTDRKEAPNQAERLRQLVEKYRFELEDGQSTQLTCSIGFAAYPFLPQLPEELNWEQVMTIAEQALYNAQKSDGNVWIGINGTEKTKTANLYQRIRKEINNLIAKEELTISASIPDQKSIIWMK